ncbi:MAG TPA: hypothetical protein VEY49_08985 [Solirubrobacteraceae bacterium]|jgi:hypothetical protein|nr:hypothetical protein [Solirubrobacteraceae bacterium]
MPPVERFICRFAAEPPQETSPNGDWAQTLQSEFLAACLRIDGEGQEIGEAGELRWFPDRTWNRRTYVPVTARTTTGLELFGYVSFIAGDPEASGSDAEPSSFRSTADFTDETAEANPDWRIDLCEEVIGTWRGEGGHRAEMTLVWGVPLLSGARVATAELAGLAVDQCALADDRFTLIAPDAYRSDYVDVKLWDADGRELASESLYVEVDEEER